LGRCRRCTHHPNPTSWAAVAGVDRTWRAHRTRNRDAQHTNGPWPYRDHDGPGPVDPLHGGPQVACDAKRFSGCTPSLAGVHTYLYIYIYIKRKRFVTCVWSFRFYCFLFTLSRKPQRVIKRFLGAVARYTQLMGPWRTMATPFLWCQNAQDPARVVDGVEVCRRDHQCSENYLRKIPIVK
jgi:hypothetical protein